MNPVEEAAQLLIRQFNRPANEHSIFIRKVDGDAATGREDRYVVMVAVRPSCRKAFPSIPDHIMGVPVREYPWQPDDVRDHPAYLDKIAQIAQAVP